MENSFDSFLGSIKIFMVKIEGFGKDFEGKMNIMREIEHHLQGINQLRIEDKNQAVVAVRDACKLVVYSRYVEAETKTTALAKIHSKMDIEKFPESLRPKGIEITGYVDEIMAQLQRVTNVINEIAKMVSGYY